VTRRCGGSPRTSRGRGGRGRAPSGPGAGSEAAVGVQFRPVDPASARQPSLRVGGRGVTVGTFVDEPARRRGLGTIFGAAVVDMEAAALAHVAYANDIPFIAFRAVSDFAGHGGGENAMWRWGQNAAVNAAAAVEAFPEDQETT